MKNYIVGISGLSLSLYVYFASKSFERVGSGLANNPAYYPRILAIVLAFLSLILFIDSLKKRAKVSFHVDTELMRNLSLFLAALLIYILLLKPVGFVLTTIAFIICMTWFLGGTRKQAVIASIPMSLIVYIVFSFILKVPLPKGILPFL